MDDVSTLAKQFISLGEKYLDCWQMENLAEGAIRDEAEENKRHVYMTPIEKLGREMLEAQAKRRDAGNVLNVAAQNLACAMKHDGHDPVDVFRAANCTERGGGGPKKFNEIWQDTKARLRALAIAPKQIPGQETKQPKYPKPVAWQAYRIREAGIEKQEEIAKALMQHTGKTASQGYVSKLLSSVDDYLVHGGVAPSEEEFAKMVTMDPAVIDMGARSDNRTPRQRQKALDEE